MNILNQINDCLWGYLLVFLLIACAIFFTVRSRGVQFRLFRHSCALLFQGGKTGEKSISPFKAFSVSLASRVGTGNLAGVASAIVVGGPGAVFWMWVIALFGAATSFVESTLAQAYKKKGADSFIGGPAYYMQHGLGRRWMGIIFAVLITVTFGLANSMLQSNTICSAVQGAFSVPRWVTGVALMLLTLVIIFGGIRRISNISSIIVPIMAVGYLILALVVVGMNIGKLPDVFSMIFRSAFGWGQVAGGGIGAAVMQGFKRGLFSNEAGEGSAPNAAATADIDHPVSQGLVQALGVFVDTLFVCSCTAFIILSSGVDINGGCDGIELTQAALQGTVGGGAVYFITLAIFFFAFSSVLGNTYYGEANIRFFTQRRVPMTIYRIGVCVVVLLGAFVSLETSWVIIDILMGLLTLCNLLAIVPLSGISMRLLSDYCAQLRRGVKSPIFKVHSLPESSRRGITEWD